MQAAIGSGMRLRRRPLMLICIFATFLIVYLRYSRSVDREAAALAAGWQPASPPQAATADGGKVQEGEEQKLKAGSEDGAPAQKPLAPMSYGTASRPPFKDLKNVVAELPSDLLPQPGSGPRRLVIVGDVHGMKAPLERLLEKVGFKREGGDHLIIVGDLINKGPDSAGVVELAMSLRASAVRGNNEDRVLLAHQAMRSRLVPGTNGDDGPAAFGIPPGSDLLEDASDADVAADEPKSRRRWSLFQRSSGGGGDKRSSSEAPPSQASTALPEPDTLEQNPFSHGDQSDRGTVASLTQSQLAWLAGLPVILRVGTVRNSPFTNLVVVHAGMVPGIAPERQDPWAVMNMRTLVYPGREARKDRIKEELENRRKAKAGKTAESSPPSSAVTAQQVEAELAARRRKGQERNDGGHDDVAVPVEGREGEQWTEAWARYQREQVAREEDRVTVVYGHDARRGLSVPSTLSAAIGGRKGGVPKLEPGSTFGLDSGCVYGRQLSALVIEATAEGEIRHELVHVDCEDGRAHKGGKGRKQR